LKSASAQLEAACHYPLFSAPLILSDLCQKSKFTLKFTRIVSVSLWELSAKKLGFQEVHLGDPSNQTQSTHFLIYDGKVSPTKHCGKVCGCLVGAFSPK